MITGDAIPLRAYLDATVAMRPPANRLQQFRGKFAAISTSTMTVYRTERSQARTRTHGAFEIPVVPRSDEYGVYTEDGDAYRRNASTVWRRKWDTAAEFSPGSREPAYQPQGTDAESGPGDVL